MAIEIDWQSLDADGNWLERDRAAKLQAKLEAIRFKNRRKHHRKVFLSAIPIVGG
jgi:hypothetical protein